MIGVCLSKARVSCWSINYWISCLHLGFSPMGIPKYKKGRDKILQFKYLTYLSTTSSSTLIPPNLLLREFTFNPDAISKHLNKLLIATTLLILISPTKIGSYVYCNRLTSTYFSPTLKSKNKFSEVVYLIKPLSPSATMLIRKEAKGSRVFLLKSSLQYELHRRTTIDKDWNWARDKATSNPVNPIIMKSHLLHHVKEKFQHTKS